MDLRVYRDSPASMDHKRNCGLVMIKRSHSFIVIPECPYPLLGRDLLTKMKAQINFIGKGVTISQLSLAYALCLGLEENRLFPQMVSLEVSH